MSIFLSLLIVVCLSVGVLRNVEYKYIYAPKDF